jgi:arylsulfatase A-like enzyme
MLVILVLAGCNPPPPAVPSAPMAARDAPNVLWIVWDTVRPDYLSLYQHARPTTPRLDAWANTARVFDNVVSPGSTTLPAHASMFTGLLPTEHGVSHLHEMLDAAHDTIAEILQRGGYRTYMFSANAFISSDYNFAQGFETVEHPWSDKYAQRAFEIVAAKVAGDQSSELTGRMARGPQAALQTRQNIKACGELAIDGLVDWLKATDSTKPYFAFINWMEAHRQLVPARKYRERFMSPEQVEKSYRVDRSWLASWEYTVGLHEYSEDELALTRATYEAAIAELDDHFGDLLDALRAVGKLENTIVIVTADHGEQLGEHHMLDHQFSVYEELLRVPLIICDPAKLPAGRESRPVMTQDLFATLLERAGLPLPRGVRHSLSLASPRESRDRLAEYPAPFMGPLKDVIKGQKEAQDKNPTQPPKEFDPTPWRRSLRAFYVGDMKVIRSSDGKHELYDLKSDPHEQNNLAAADVKAADPLLRKMMELRKQLRKHKPSQATSGPGPDARGRVQAGGYTGGAEAVEDDDWDDAAP